MILILKIVVENCQFSLKEEIFIIIDKNLEEKEKKSMMLEEKTKSEKFKILIWGITLMICAAGTYFIELALIDSSSWAFFSLIGPIFLLVAFFVLIVGIIKALSKNNKNEIQF